MKIFIRVCWAELELRLGLMLCAIFLKEQDLEGGIKPLIFPLFTPAKCPN